MLAFQYIGKSTTRIIATVVSAAVLSRPILKWPTPESDGIDNPFYSNLSGFHSSLIKLRGRQKSSPEEKKDENYQLTGPHTIFTQRQLPSPEPISTCTFTDKKYEFPQTRDRHEHLNQLATDQYDVLVIGGGVVGTATAVEATKRGFKVALIDKNDFAACTSSRSTKLIHGGVRYLEQAIMQFDPPMLSLVREALRERSHMLKCAPYMNKPLPIIIPLDSYWQLPYMYIGTKLYEFFAPKDVPKAHLMSREQTLAHFPNIDLNKFKLIGSIVYYDGQTNDSRLTLSLALTAENDGATVANYVEFKNFIKDSNGHIQGAIVVDHISGKEIQVKTHSVVNAAGPFADKIRQLDNPACDSLIIPVVGIHLAMKDDVASPDYGLLVPKTPDNRVLFLLPWEKSVIAGTTDAPSELADVPTPSTNDIEYIIRILNSYMKGEYTMDDVKSVWAGLRPLVRDVEALHKAKGEQLAHIDTTTTPPVAVTTSKLSRNHVVLPSHSGLVSVMGGKLTTHRQMAEDTVDALIETVPYFKQYNAMLADHQLAVYNANVKANPDASPSHPFTPKERYITKSNTFNQPIYGADNIEELTGATSYGAIEHLLEQTYKIDRNTSEALVNHYGTRALAIASKAIHQCRISPSTEKVDRDCMNRVELDYMIDNEMVQHVDDIVFRRQRTGFIDTDATIDETEKVLPVMASRFGWDEERKEAERQRVRDLLDKMDIKRLLALSSNSVGGVSAHGDGKSQSTTVMVIDQSPNQPNQQQQQQQHVIDEVLVDVVANGAHPIREASSLTTM